MEQLFLFEGFSPDVVFINENGIDVSAIPPLNFLSKDISKPSKQRTAKTEKMKRISLLEKGKFIIFPSGGEHCLPEYKSLGKVFPFIRHTKYPEGHKWSRVGVRTSRNQYPCLTLGGIDLLAHEIFAMAFIENKHPDIYWMIDHEDEDKMNNQITNLNWVTQAYNQEKAMRRKDKKEELPPCDFMI